MNYVNWSLTADISRVKLYIQHNTIHCQLNFAEKCKKEVSCKYFK